MKKRFFSILLVLVLPIISIGQNLDSLYAIIEGDDEDTIRIKTMLQTSQLLQNSDEEEAIYLANTASILAVQSKEYKLAAQSFNQLGLLSYFKGHLKDCKAYFEEAMTYYDLAELPLGIASAGNNIGVIEYEQGFYYNALNYFAESLLIRKANNDSATISVSYNNIGNVYKDIGQLFKAKEFYQKSIDLKLILEDDYGLAMTYNNLGQVYHELKNYDKAIDLYNTSIEIKEDLGDEHGLAMTLANLGNSQKEQGDYESAEINIKKSFDLRTKIGDDFGLLHSNLILAQLYAIQENYAQAETLFHNSLSAASEMQAFVQVRDSYFGLYQCYEYDKNFEKALDYHKKYSLLNDSLITAENLKVATQIEVELEVAEKDEQIQKLTEKVESRIPFWKESWFEFLLFFSVLGLITLIIIFYLNRNKKVGDEGRNRIDQLRILRLLFLTAALMSPVLGFYRSSLSSSIFDPIWLRIGFSLLILTPLIGSYRITWIRDKFDSIAVQLYYILTALLFFLLYKNSINNSYFIDVIVVAAVAPAIFSKLKPFLVYLSFYLVLGAVFYGLVADAEMQLMNYSISIVISLGVVWLTFISKQNSQNQLNLSNEIVNEVDALVFIADRTGQTIYASNSVQKILGYHPSDVISKDWHTKVGFTLEDSVVAKKYVSDVATGKIEPKLFDFQSYKTKDGEQKWIEWKDKRIEGDRLLAVGQDVTERKRILDDLQESESKFRLINETLSDVFYLYNIQESRYEYISRDCKEILGADPEFFYSGQSHRAKFVLKDDLDIVVEANKKVDAGESYEIEFRIVIDGEIKWIREKSVPIKNEAGEIYRNCGACQDITVLKKNQEELQKLSLVASNTTNYVIIAHVENGIEWVNEAFIEKFGYSKEEVFGKFPSELIHGEITKDIDIINEVVFKKGKKYSGEIIHKTKAGKRVYAKVDIIPLKNETGVVDKYFVLGVDLTDNKEQEKAIEKSHNTLKLKEAELAKSELNFRHLIGSIKQVFWLSDFETRELLFVSESYEKVFGYPGESLKKDPKSWSNTIHPEDKEIAIQEFITNGALGKFDLEYRILVKDKIRWVHSRTYQVLDDTGKAVMLSGITEDITEKKLQGLELENLNRRLAVIHEIENTILTSESTEEIIYNTLNKTLSLLPILRSSLTLFNYKNNEFYAYTSKADNQVSLTNKKIFSLSDFSVLDDLTESKKHIIQNLKEKKEKSKTDLILIEEGVNASLMSPLFHGNVLIGSFNVCFKDGVETMESMSDYISITNEIASGLAIAIQQSKLKEEIEHKNIEITSSINYAKMIQDAHLPQDLNHEGMLPNHCLFFRPKDIVSGDFYWTEKMGDDLVIVIGDCTGHGVPGAFMTVIGINLLSKIVSNQKITDPGTILTELNIEIKKSLSSKRKIQIEDGMDVGVCVFNQKTKTLKFAGAKRPLIHMCDGELKTIEANKYSVGSAFEKAVFSTQTINCGSKNRFYIFSDGFPDQFGGPDVRKYNRRRVYDLIEDISDLDFKEQELAVNKAFDNWKGANKQTDDVVFAGFQF